MDMVYGIKLLATDAWTCRNSRDYYWSLAAFIDFTKEFWYFIISVCHAFW